MFSQGTFFRTGFYCHDKSGEIYVSNDESIMYFSETRSCEIIRGLKNGNNISFLVNVGVFFPLPF